MNYDSLLPLTWYFPDSCPGGYTIASGDVQGWGSISGNHQDKSMIGCQEMCDNTRSCCSFEWSPTTRVCNLNNECRPTRGQFKDYLFCMKGTKKALFRQVYTLTHKFNRSNQTKSSEAPASRDGLLLRQLYIMDSTRDQSTLTIVIVMTAPPARFYSV